MGFYIIPTGEVSYTVADELFEVDSSDLVPGGWNKTGEAQFKGDDEEYTVDYVANTPHGKFTYTLTLSIGENGAEITSLWADFPQGLSFNEGAIEFEITQGEDE
ncbi:hypothetical protein [Pseudomonas putida]|uniref:hypothetical protein n=1 Tax=Pseudomonas putida TaxID=303 RepID=UPI0015FBABEA|nr:hypothetical protein [Pseudomonas putida]MDD2002539.1 hypothetical protein [Pseudomonas putida]